jgi:ribosomal protein L29
MHALWFVCLKERNLLLTERLFYRQVGQAAPEPERLRKVKLTMARIKVVLGERSRAAEALERDTLLMARLKEGATTPGAEASGVPAVSRWRSVEGRWVVGGRRRREAAAHYEPVRDGSPRLPPPPHLHPPPHPNPAPHRSGASPRRACRCRASW